MSTANIPGCFVSAHSFNKQLAQSRRHPPLRCVQTLGIAWAACHSTTLRALGWIIILSGPLGPCILPTMSTILRTLRNLRKIGIKEYAHQMQYMGDTKAGTYIATDKYGNKYYENLEQELPCASPAQSLNSLLVFLADLLFFLL